jgi:RNAse (barnase) inhibitor barstar
MSALTKLLDGEISPGVYLWHSADDHSGVEAAAIRDGWRFVHLDTSTAEDKDGFLDACRRDFDFPDWVGHNYDALDDALGDVRGITGTGVVVVWDNWSPMACDGRDVFDVALDIFNSRVRFEPAGPFSVLLRGPGPCEVDLPELDPYTEW